jgi:hypothetical protein
MRESGWPAKLERARTLSDIFELVKRAVESTLGLRRAGLMLALADLGGTRSQWLGAYYPVATNVIVMNRSTLRVLEDEKPELWKPYAFHVLLHEYLHTVGYLDELSTRHFALMVTEQLFGAEHVATDIARDITKYLPAFVYPELGFAPRYGGWELVRDFDRGSASYIR